MHKFVLLGFLLFSPCTPIPFPQTDDALDYYYDEYTPVVKEATGSSSSQPPAGLPDFSGLFGALAGLGSNLIDFVSRKEFQDRVSETVMLGTNITSTVARMAVPLVQGAIREAPRLVSMGQQSVNGVVENERLQEQLRNVGEVASQAVGQVPMLVESGGSLVHSLIRATNDTAPLVINGLREAADQAPLLASFARAYAEVNAKQTVKIAERFNSSLQCQLNCGNLTSDAKAECERKHCTTTTETATSTTTTRTTRTTTKSTSSV